MQDVKVSTSLVRIASFRSQTVVFGNMVWIEAIVVSYVEAVAPDPFASLFSDVDLCVMSFGLVARLR